MPTAITTFVLRDFSLTNIVDALEGLVRKPPQGHRVVVPGLGREIQQGSVFENYVRAQIDDCGQVLALCDLPNANVGFEIGYALGRGRHVVLASARATLPDWIAAHPPFKGHFVTSASSLTALRKIVVDAAHAPGSRVRLKNAIEPGGTTLVLCPTDHGEAHLELVDELCPDWKRLPSAPWTFDDVPKLLRGVGRVVWIVPPMVGGVPEDRDGSPSSALAVLAGIARATDGVELVVLRSDKAREIVDVKDGERLFASLEQLGKQIESIRLQPVHGGRSSAAEEPVDQIAAYRSYLSIHFVTRAPFGYEVLDAHDCHVRLSVMRRPGDEAGKRLARRSGAEVSVTDGDTPDPFAGRSTLTLDALLANTAQRTPGEWGPGGKRWVVVAPPGAGKTTSARGLCSQLANESDGPVPIFLSLPELLEGAGDLFERAAQAASDVVAAIDESELAKELTALAQQPGRVWLILDAWDEVLRNRERVQDLVTSWLRSFPGMSVLVTTRQTGYDGLPGFADEAELQPLDEERRGHLLERWLGPARRDAVLRELARRPAVRLLSSNPLFLTFIARAFHEDGALPHTRGELYERTITLLLERGAERDSTGLGVNVLATRKLLEALSLELVQSGAAAWTREQLFTTFGRLTSMKHSDHDSIRSWLAPWNASPEAFLRDVARLSGILGSHDGPRRPWRFLHRTLGEYLAACAIHGGDTNRVEEFFASTKKKETSIESLGETLGLVVDLVEEEDECLVRLRQLHDIAPESFRRTLVQVDRPRPIDVARVVLESEASEGEDLLALFDRWIAGGEDLKALACELTEFNGNSDWAAVPVGSLRERQAWVAYAVSTNAGNDDGWVSEWWERFWQTCELSERRLQPPIDWCIVPGGHFDIVHGRHYDERPNQTVAVLSFELAKTPVTRAQYLAFDPERVGNSSDETPMTGLSWWEAWLFCRWVGGRLPSEDEWEYACRGGGSHSGRPDGADLQQYLEQNGDELMRPVASRPANSFGLHDMQELVWEWCLDGSLDFDSGVQGGELARGDHLAAFRVLRGLAWHIVRGWARAKLRASKKPSFRIDYVGFRPAR